MTPHIAALMDKIQALENELGAELAKRRAELRIGLGARADRVRRGAAAPPSGVAPQAVALCARRQSAAGVVPFLPLDPFVGVYQTVCWCPIKLARRVIGTHARYAMFDDYGDAEGYQEQLAKLRKALAKDGA